MPPQRHYESTGTLAVALRLVFGAWLLLEAFALGGLISLHGMINTLVNDPYAYFVADTQTQFWNSLSLVEQAFWFVLAGLFIAWMYQAYLNLDAYGAVGSRYGSGWAIGGWFIPIGNLFIPKRIVDDMWKSSEPGLRTGTLWHHNRVDIRVHLWWVTFLAGRILLIVGSMMASTDSATLEDFQRGMPWSYAGLVIEMAAAFLAIWLVASISTRQADLVAASGRRVSDRQADRWLKPQILGLAAAVLLLTIIGIAYFREEPLSSRTDSATGLHSDGSIVLVVDGE